MSENYFDQFITEEAPQAPAPEGNFFDQFEPQPAAPTPVEEITAEPTFLERTLDTLSKEYGEAKDALGNVGLPQEDETIFEWTKSNRNPSTALTTVVGADLIPAVGSVAFDAAITGIGKLIPEEWKDNVKSFAADRWQEAQNNPVIAQGLEFATDNIGKYMAWADANPDEARKVETIFNVGTMMSPATKGVKSPVQPASKYLRRADKKNLSAQKLGKAQDWMVPDNMRGPGRLGVDAKDNKVYELSPWENDVAAEVAQASTFNPNRSVAYNMQAVRNKAIDARQRLEKFIEKKGNPEVSRVNLNNKWNAALNKLDEENIFLTGDARNSAVAIIEKAQKLLDKEDGTALGVLRARRELDQWVTQQKPKHFDADAESAATAGMKAVRDVMNEAVEEATGPTVRRLLNKQSKLLYAGDVLETKARKEAEGIFGRMLQKLEGSTGVRTPTTPLSIALTASGAANLAMGMPGLAAASGAGLLGVQAWKTVMTPLGRRKIYNALDAMGKDLFATETLRSDRAALIALMQDLETNFEETEEE